MPNYKLIYANGRGKAETSRMLFKLAGQEFEDVRQEKEEWLKLKPNTPYGERPILMFDGVTLAQSRAIERLLAKRFNLYGTTDVEQARTDMLIDCMSDLENILFAIYRGDNKEEAKKKFLEEKGPTSFNFIEKMLSDGGFFLGDKISWADVALLNNMHYFDMVEVDMTAILDQVPKIKTLLENVKKHPTIAEWISKRAVTQF